MIKLFLPIFFILPALLLNTNGYAKASPVSKYEITFVKHESPIAYLPYPYEVAINPGGNSCSENKVYVDVDKTVGCTGEGGKGSAALRPTTLTISVASENKKPVEKKSCTLYFKVSVDKYNGWHCVSRVQKQKDSCQVTLNDKDSYGRDIKTIHTFSYFINHERGTIPPGDSPCYPSSDYPIQITVTQKIEKK